MAVGQQATTTNTGGGILRSKGVKLGEACPVTGRAARQQGGRARFRGHPRTMKENLT